MRVRVRELTAGARVETVDVVLVLVLVIEVAVLVEKTVVEVAEVVFLGAAAVVVLDVDRTGAFEVLRNCSILCCFLA